MTRRTWMSNWPVYRQIAGTDRLGRGVAARSPGTAAAEPRTERAQRVVSSICPYCAVGCAQQVYVERVNGTDTVTQIEGHPDSPVSQGRLCPKGAASKQLVTNPGRQTSVLYRRPYGTAWEALSLDRAMDMITDRVIKARAEHWQEHWQSQRARRTLAMASLGGATLDNEENYLIKKLWSALGAIQIENQARI